MDVPGLLKAAEGLRFDLPPGRPAIYRASPQRMLEAVPLEGPRGPARTAGLLLAAVRSLGGIQDGARDERLRRRWDPSQGGREILGLPLPPGAAPDGAAGVSTWEYGIVGSIQTAGASGEAKRRAFELLKRHVQEQGYGILPDGHEEVCLGDPLRDGLDSAETLLVCRLARFY